MATVIPNLSTLRNMTPGERRLGQRLETLLEDDYTVWYDIPLGRQRRLLDQAGAAPVVAVAEAVGAPGLGELPIWVPLILSLAFAFTVDGKVRKWKRS